MWIDVLKVVTAFTIAHSITRSLQVLALPSRWVEAALVLSVLLFALLNFLLMAMALALNFKECMDQFLGIFWHIA